MMQTPSFIEDHISQIPALQLLKNLGYTYLTPEEVLKERQDKLSNVILEDILEQQLLKFNKIQFKGKIYPFSPASIRGAIDAIKNVPMFDGLVTTNSKIYDLLTLGKSYEESIGNDRKSFTINYIDWNNIENNVFHVAEEFEVNRTLSDKKYRPDIVLFVNGIPLCIIECKRPDIKEPLEQAISQHLRNQQEDGIPHLYKYSQILLALTSNKVQYATTGTPRKFWATWKEQKLKESDLQVLVNKSLSDEQKDKLFADRFKYVRKYFDNIEAEGRLVTEQDKLLYSLCKPDRLLEFVYKYIVFDSGIKKIARYQQYFAIQDTLERIKIIRDERRQGGVIWHTQGSGKSLTMVMLAKAISLEPEIVNPKVIIVTDRIDLDKQISDTFKSCGKVVKKATSGEDLGNIIVDNKETIITTVINKFQAALRRKKVIDNSKNIFVLVDESHRSQYGSANALMQKVFPNACYIGFTGTPLMKKEKSTAVKFGGIIGTPYTINQAVEDEAVLPLYYESRLAVQNVTQNSIDKYFDIISRDLTDKQKADLKKKFSTRRILNEAEQKIANVALDISQHFEHKYKGTGFKGQLTAPSKAIALKYKKYLDELGMVSSEVVISSPDTREGNDDIYKDKTSEVNQFWKRMMDRFGNESEYNAQIINQFKNAPEPEILIVVDKLLTGFDAPKNSVLYIARSLKEHGLLQAIARVNRLEEGKDYGEIIDYYGLLTELDEALLTYSNIGDFDEKDIQDALVSAQEEIKKLPQLHSDLWEIFNGINKYDIEAYEQHLKYEDDRDKFYDKLSQYSKVLQLALGNFKFLEETPERKITTYKNDLKFFLNLRVSLKSRYAESIDRKEYESKIQKLIDTYVTSDEIIQVTEPVDIFDTEKFKAEVEKKQSTRSKADTIAYRISRTIYDKFDDDPIFYKKLSELLKEAIAKYSKQIFDEAERLKNDNAYFNKVSEILTMARTRTGDDIPASILNNEVAKAFYGVVYEKIKNYNATKDNAAELALKIDKIILDNQYVDWIKNTDLQNKIINDIEDILFEFKDSQSINLTYDEIDYIIEESMKIAKRRYAK
ncbi:MAG: type I restriction endonuclease subunit R [Candidatus Gastranaerophilaceae bacterium]